MSGPPPSAPPGGESGLVVLVPQAEEVVGPHRARLDPWAAQAVPAHITLLTPFVPPELVDDDVRRRVGRVLDGFAPFSFFLTEVGWFADDVLWLAPEPAGPFQEMTAALVAEVRVPIAARVDDVVLLGRTTDRPFTELHRFSLGGQ